MARSVRSGNTNAPPRVQSPLRSWFVALGIPAIAIGVGVSLIGYTNFWIGFVILNLAILSLAIDLWTFFPKKSKKVGSAIVILTIECIIIWLILMPAPLELGIAPGLGSIFRRN
jgi:hypothetical protein